MYAVKMRWPRTPEQRFWDHVDTSGDCWIVTSAPNNSGYGRTWKNGRRILAHRWAYEFIVGPIPDGLTIDHLCRNRRCVRPEHLEPVPKAVNTLRGEALSAQNARKLTCPRGHPYDAIRMGQRCCKRCQAAAAARYVARKKVRR